MNPGQAARRRAQRRIGARAVDVGIYFAVVTTVGGLVVPDSYAKLDSALGVATAYFAAVFSYAFAEAQVVRFFGNTIGKAVFGIRVLTQDGHELSSSQVQDRSQDALFQGALALVPLFTPVGVLNVYRRLARGEAAPWDAACSYRVDFFVPGIAKVATLAIAVAVTGTLCSITAWAKGLDIGASGEAYVWKTLKDWISGREPQRWINPVSGREVELPEYWTVDYLRKDFADDSWEVSFAGAEGTNVVLKRMGKWRPQMPTLEEDLASLYPLGDAHDSEPSDFQTIRAITSVGPAHALSHYISGERKVDGIAYWTNVLTWKTGGEQYWTMVQRGRSDTQFLVDAILFGAVVRASTFPDQSIDGTDTAER